MKPRLRSALALLGLLAFTAQAASLNDPAAVPHLNERGRDGYRHFLVAEPHRAFAIAPGGGWGMSEGAASADQALQQAIQACQQHTRQRCVGYAVNRTVVFDARAWARLWRPYASAAEARRASVGTERGQRFPDLLLGAPDGRPFKLSDVRGRVVVVHFWATWCPTCRHELPQFVRLQQRFADQRDLVFVFTQVRESAATSRQWLRQQNIELALHDSGARSTRDQHLRLAGGQSLPDRQIAPVFPATYVLDRHGVVVFSMVGSADDWQQYAPFLRDLLSHRP